MLEQRVIGMVLGQKVRISERDLKDYYQETMTERTQEYEVDAAHIVVRVTTGASPADEAKARTTAMAILKRAQDGEDFGARARETSQAPGAENGGDLGTLQRGNLHESLENAIFSMEAGEVDGPFRSPFGYHVVKVRARRALPAQSYEALKESLRSKRFEMSGWMEVRAKSFVVSVCSQNDFDCAPRLNGRINLQFYFTLNSRRSGGEVLDFSHGSIAF